MSKETQKISDQNTTIIHEAPITVAGEELNEIKLSWAGKIFFAGAAAYITGKGLQQKVKLPLKIRGTPQQIKAIMDAVVGSKAFQQEISRPGATIDQVIDKLRLRNLSKARYRQITGKNFPI